ncbi:E3 ubiquitin-protein ligase TRIM47-like [Paramisgurnus dabryanus]|uniref:E3 ubiquitin-protein ligase TRIM47-like n=1 Tax=Paramisgurnus dabryanus TaxID=90735 RepID=UPI0031F4084D
MAEASVSQDQFSCSICLDLLKDPVTIPCGHSYCMSCIAALLDHQMRYSCPQCRQTFTTRPVLRKNTMLAEMVEKLKKTKLQAARPDHCYAEAGDVECDVCTERKHKAVKSCLVCLNSYCQNHLEQHEELHSGKRHKMTDATGRLQEMICPQHNKALEIYCRTDQLCICYLCMVNKHNNHKTVSAAAERTLKQKQLKKTKRKYQQRIQESQKKLQELRDAVKTHKRSAQAAVEDTERIFTLLIRSIKRRRSEVTQLIRDQEKTAVSRAEGLLKRLEQEIDDLRRRDAELKQLSHTDDHIHFLQSFQSLSVPPGSSDSLSITVSSLISFDDVVKSVSHLREKVEDFCREEIGKLFYRVKYIDIIPIPEPDTREHFLQYYHQITPDLNAVKNYLSLFEGNRMITHTDTVQPYPDHPDGFEDYPQVLCSESGLKDAEVFTPEYIDRDDESKGTNVYRFVSPHAGQFQCSLTNLVFVMEGKGEVLYKIVSWDPRLLDGLGQMQPAGPLYNIDCFKGSISQLHLPHCEVFSEKNEVSLAVAHFSDGNVEMLQSIKVSSTHLIINITEFSLFGLIKDIIFPVYPVCAQVLLFLRPKSFAQKQKILNVHLLPGNVPLSEVQSQHQEKTYIETSSICHLIPGKEYKLCCHPEECEVQPSDEVFVCNFGPNFHTTFEVFLNVSIEEVRLGLLDSDNKGKEVWKQRRVLLSAPAQGVEPPVGRRFTESEFLDKHRDQLIQRVTSVMEIADCLMSKYMITGEMYKKVHSAEPRQEKMRIVFDVLESGGSAVKAEFWRLLKEREPHLVDELESEPSTSQ